MRYKILDPAAQIDFLTERLRDYEFKHFNYQTQVEEADILGEGYEQTLAIASKAVDEFERLCEYVSNKLEGLKETPTDEA